MMVQTNLLVLVKNFLFQLTSIFGKMLRTLRAVELKHAAKRSANNQDYNHYFENKESIRQWISETYTMKESDRFYVV